mgnify:CR=1 FL=1
MVAKPNISVLSLEAFMMFAHNKTLRWLNSKDPAQERKLIGEAMRERKFVLKLFQDRHKRIQQARHDAIQAKIRKEEETKRQKLLQLQEYTDAIVSHGLWQSTAEVENMLAG